MNHDTQPIGAEDPKRGFDDYVEKPKPVDLDDHSPINDLEAVANEPDPDNDHVFQGRIMEDAESDLSATSDDRLIALLCYWTQLVMPLVMPLIVLLSASGKSRSFQRHHAIQSLGLTAGIFGLSVASMVAAVIATPFTGGLVLLLAVCLSPIVYFMSVSAYVFYGWQAHKGIRFSIPFLSNFLRKQGWLE